ncbi:MAG: hypothetical protein ACJ8CR_07635, partial [Roseiflexaceae bacterium]
SGTFSWNAQAQQFSMHAFGAQFAEVQVHEETGEVRVPRLLDVRASLEEPTLASRPRTLLTAHHL